MAKRVGILPRLALFAIGFPIGVIIGSALVVSLRLGNDLASPTGGGRVLWPVAHATPASPPVAADSQTADLADLQASLSNAAKNARMATVVVAAADHHARAYAVGSGAIVSPDGLILTAGHVIGEPGQEIEVTLHDGTKLTGESLGLSLYSDAGMARISPPDGRPLPHFQVASPGEEPVSGDWVFALGHPGGPDVDRGPVLRLGRVQEVLDAFTFITSCKLLGGDSGGPLVDLSGRLVGIHSRISDDIDGNYHARTAAFQRRWDALEDGHVLGLQDDQGMVGVLFGNASARPEIVGLVPSSPAQNAQLRVGDLFTHINEERVETPSEFSSLIAERFSGEKVSLRYLRDGKTETVEIALMDARDANAPTDEER